MPSIASEAGSGTATSPPTVIWPTPMNPAV
jgi:hypothetical protein